MVYYRSLKTGCRFTKNGLSNLVSDKLAEQVLSLPIWPELSKATAQRVVWAVANLFEEAALNGDGSFTGGVAFIDSTRGATNVELGVPDGRARTGELRGNSGSPVSYLYRSATISETLRGNGVMLS